MWRRARGPLRHSTFLAARARPRAPLSGPRDSLSRRDLWLGPRADPRPVPRRSPGICSVDRRGSWSSTEERVMSAYVNRLLDRFSPTASDATASINPFVRSHSPIAQFDQRLDFDDSIGFADTFEAEE